MSETKFKKLFEYGVDFDVGGISQTLMQNRCGELTSEHIDYIETATIMHGQLLQAVDELSTELLHMIRAENARLLQSVNSTDLDGPDYLGEESVYLARKLLAKARGEHE